MQQNTIMQQKYLKYKNKYIKQRQDGGMFSCLTPSSPAMNRGSDDEYKERKNKLCCSIQSLDIKDQDIVLTVIEQLVTNHATIHATQPPGDTLIRTVQNMIDIPNPLFVFPITGTYVQLSNGNKRMVIDTTKHAVKLDIGAAIVVWSTCKKYKLMILN